MVQKSGELETTSKTLSLRPVSAVAQKKKPSAGRVKPQKVLVVELICSTRCAGRPIQAPC